MNKYEVWGRAIARSLWCYCSKFICDYFSGLKSFSLTLLLSPTHCTSFSVSDLPFFLSSKNVTQSHVMNVIVLIPAFSCPISEKVQCRIFTVGVEAEQSALI